MKKIEIPEKCPSCGSQLEKVGPELYCKNEECPAKSSKTLENFCSNLNVKGLGPKRLEQLNITSIRDLLELPKQAFIDAFGEKVGDKVFEQLESCKEVDFGTLLGGLSIPRVGVNTGRKIAQEVSSFNELKDQINNLTFGPSVKASLTKWFQTKYPLLEPVLSDFKLQTQRAASSKGLTVCLTGKLENGWTRNKAKQELEVKGYKVTSTVSKNTDLLICDNPSNSSKEQKAQQLNIPIIKYQEIENYV